MKKIIVFAIFITCIKSFASITVSQGNWRWRKDDGTEQSATWLADANTSISVSAFDPIRLRITVNTNGIPEILSLHDSLMYMIASISDWQPITLSNSNNDFVFEGSSSYVTDELPTTSQISPASNFTVGKIILSSNELHAAIPGGNHSEYEWCIKPTAHLKSNTTYYFRMSGIPDPGISEYATLITTSVLPINLVNFILTKEGSSAKISWATASELNNDHFEIERSTDGTTNWKVVVTVAGSGTTSRTQTYTVYDRSPLNGKNFYRVKQIDKDGKCKISEVRFLLMKDVKVFLTVYPNPTKNDINFTSNYTGRLSIALRDLNSKTVHKENISPIASNSRYKLKLQHRLRPGIYVLLWKGEGFHGSSKVLIQ